MPICEPQICASKLTFIVNQGARRNFTASSTANQLRLGPACASSTFVPASKTPSLNDLAKRETCLPSTRVEESAPLHEFVNKKSSNLPDQKSLKVRIKVGSDNLSAQKNAAIYSGLGLDVSPSSSLENGPSESEGMCHEYASFESPAKILMVNVLPQFFRTFHFSVFNEVI